MKKYLLLFLLFSFSAISQTFNQYKYVIVPVRFEGFKEDNQYRLNTITKKKLVDLGFTVFYEYETIPSDIDKNRCNFLYVNVANISGMLNSKVQVVFKDCMNKSVYESEAGTSRLKEYAASYQEALNKAFATVKYSYDDTPKAIVAAQKETVPENQASPKPAIVNTPVAGVLKAEATSIGYLLIDETTSKIEMKISRTSSPQAFLAARNGIQGVLVQKGSEWFFDYYQNDKLVSEKINVTF